MATQNLNFASSVSDWVKAEKDRMRAVAQESTQRLVSVINDGVPIDTGFARASVRASTSEMPKIDPSFKGKEGQSYGADLSSVTATITGLQLGQTIHVGWTAAYILPLEYGHSKQAPQGFVRIGCAQWNQIVASVSTEAKGRAG